MNKELWIKVGIWNNSILWCTVEKTSFYIVLGASSLPSILWTTCGLPRRILWVVEQFWCLCRLRGQSNMSSLRAIKRICITGKYVWNPKNQGMRVNLSVPCLLSEDFKTEFCYMCRTNKSADRHYLCQS